MKYIVMLGDGMADLPLKELNGKTPLEAAHKPCMDYMAKHGDVGMAKHLIKGLPLGSDVANLSVMGYDPMKYYSGRSPLEAVSLGIDMEPDDIAMRCNLVTLSNEDCYEDKTMVDYSSGEITTEEAGELIEYLKKHLDTEESHLFAGISYRHCLILNHAETGTVCVPPHDISGQSIHGKLPKGKYGELCRELMMKSYELLKEHPINKSRIERGLNPANSCWFWGEGTRPSLPLFDELYGLKGAVVCGVDLIRGIGLCAGIYAPHIDGATGAKVTDFSAKGKAALKLLRDGYDFVYIHVEAPDESGHAGDIQCKISAIERIDAEILAPLTDGLDADGEEYSILLTPDHPTPVTIKTHTADAVPFVLYRSNGTVDYSAQAYDEVHASMTGFKVHDGYTLMSKLING